MITLLNGSLMYAFILFVLPLNGYLFCSDSGFVDMRGGVLTGGSYHVCPQLALHTI